MPLPYENRERLAFGAGFGYLNTDQQLSGIGFQLRPTGRASENKLNLLRVLSTLRQILFRAFHIAWPLLLLLAILFAFGRNLGPAPKLSVFLDPWKGAWVRPDDDLQSMSRGVLIPGLRGPVTVHFDDNRIPHVFAIHDEDLYAVQGYLVAADRLWQMDFISRAAAGRLSEVFGPRTLEFDKLFVKLGIPEAARESETFMYQDELSKMALQAYARGVNAYIDSLSERDMPFEYKLLEMRPERWTPLKTALLQKFMAYNLTFYTYDLALSRSFTRVSEADFNELFPLHLPIPAPIIPNGTKWSFKTLAPAAPAAVHHASAETIEPLPTPNPSNGSNNWAVSGRKSTTGKPIVSNDVHLGYGLPSLWYEMQLVSKTHNVYGATIPGAPGILLGFNSHVAWAVTNAGTDVVDWFEMRFRDELRREYKYDDAWRPIIGREHVIQVKGQEPVRIRLQKTHFGPIVYEETESPVNPSIPRGLALRWGALDPSNDIRGFLALNRATDFSSCRAAIEMHSSPAQNFICGDSAGNLGILHEGRFPVRWREQGRMISDGSDPVYDWHGFVPREELPMQINPERGFVSSANQPPTDAGYPHFLGWPFEIPYRGQRINEILESKDKFSPEDLVAMQADSEMIPARELLSVLLERLPKQGLSDLEAEAHEQLKGWNYRMEPDLVAPTIFSAWFEALQTQIWSDQFPSPQHFFVPKPHRTIQLILNEPDSKWFDRIETDTRETLDQLILLSFQESVSRLREQLGRDPETWTWGRYQPAVFPHMGRIPGLGSREIPTRGDRMAIFANRGNHGPVWKMVVALGVPDGQWALYPGGQSGHPASRYYDNFLSDWSDGKLKKVEFLDSPEQRPKSLLKTIHFASEAGGQ